MKIRSDVQALHEAVKTIVNAKVSYLVEIRGSGGDFHSTAKEALEAYKEMRKEWPDEPIAISRVEEITLEELERAAKEGR